MTRTTTATVESLQASVRVLMVGNRQVTASMAKQLDEVEPHQLIPMGRVVLGARDPQWPEITVVGAHRVTSELVRCTVVGESWFGRAADPDWDWAEAQPLLILGGLR
jgi:hypothetical protein